MAGKIKYDAGKPDWDANSILALRKHLELTQAEFADKLGTRQQTISEWETGLHTPHRSTQKTLSMVAERASFHYEDSLNLQERSEE